jgi:hypothetical protein
MFKKGDKVSYQSLYRGDDYYEAVFHEKLSDEQSLVKVYDFDGTNERFEILHNRFITKHKKYKYLRILLNGSNGLSIESSWNRGDLVLNKDDTYKKGNKLLWVSDIIEVDAKLLK